MATEVLDNRTVEVATGVSKCVRDMLCVIESQEGQGSNCNAAREKRTAAERTHGIPFRSDDGVVPRLAADSRLFAEADAEFAVRHGGSVERHKNLTTSDHHRQQHAANGRRRVDR